MPNHQSPGIYVQEISTGARPIGMVSTSTAAFVGKTPEKNRFVNQAKACNNWAEFCKFYVTEDSKSNDFCNAIYSYFNNGGSRCYIVNIGPKGSIAGDARERGGLCALETIDEISIVAAPGCYDPMTHDALLHHCEKLEDRFAILDPPPDVTNIDCLKETATISDADPNPADKKDAANTQKACRPRNSDGGYGAFYFPWIKSHNALQANQLAYIPPSGAMAGIYASTDATRGVHKAPANIQIRGALGLAYYVSRAEQGKLNKQGVNIIRSFPDGIRVWGARTLADEASEWRYIPVRRTFNMIKESIQEGTRWTVFEPNDFMTWKSIERDLRAFLMRVWRDGALMGATPEQAFFVKCDAETNPSDIRDAGQLIAEIGIAPVKPAEFIIFRIGQWSGESESASSAGA